jgi:AcrR family transcriptional regulator
MNVQGKTEPVRRSYRMKARLDAIEETRARIAEAAYELHSTVGPARTTISAVAERAGVQRHTVYHHFPDMTSLFRACTAHGIRVMNPPDPEVWRRVADPAVRLRDALGEMYGYFRQNARLLGNVARDMPMLPDAIEGTRLFLDLHEAWFEALADGWPIDAARRPALEAAIRHALDFATWHSLTSRGLTDDEACDAMTSFVTLMAGRAASTATA